MNLQETFDTVLFALRKQGFASREIFSGEKHMACAYRGKHKRKCAAGHLITDEEYDPSMENKTIEVMINGQKLKDSSSAPIKLKNIDTTNIHLVGLLQSAHDNYMPRENESNSRPIGEWEMHMARIANLLCLHYTPAIQ